MMTTMTERDSRGSTARLASSLLFGLAALVLALLSQSRPLVAVGGYALLIGTAGVGLFVTGVDVERSGRPAHAWAAGDLTLAVVGIASGVAFPGLVLAAGLGYFTWTPLATGVAFSVAGLYAVYGVVALSQWIRVQPV
jgi:hypothetical protein